MAQPGPDGLVFVSVREKSPHGTTLPTSGGERLAKQSVGRIFAGTTCGTPQSHSPSPKALTPRPFKSAWVTPPYDDPRPVRPSLSFARTQVAEGFDAAYRAALNRVQERASVTSLRDARMTQLTRG